MAKDSEWYQVFWIELRAPPVPQDLENDLAVCVRLGLADLFTRASGRE